MHLSAPLYVPVEGGLTVPATSAGARASKSYFILLQALRS